MFTVQKQWNRQYYLITDFLIHDPIKRRAMYMIHIKLYFSTNKNLIFRSIFYFLKNCSQIMFFSFSNSKVMKKKFFFEIREIIFLKVLKLILAHHAASPFSLRKNAFFIQFLTDHHILVFSCCCFHKTFSSIFLHLVKTFIWKRWRSATVYIKIVQLFSSNVGKTKSA